MKLSDREWKLAMLVMRWAVGKETPTEWEDSIDHLEEWIECMPELDECQPPSPET